MGASGGGRTSTVAAMSQTHRPIDQLTAEWHLLARRPETRDAVEALRCSAPDLDLEGITTLHDLLDHMRSARTPKERVAAAEALRIMLRSQSLHPLLPRAILQALLPGLISVARRLSWGAGGEWQDGGAFFSDLLATAWEVIVEWQGQDREYAVLDILSAIRCRARRQLMRQRETHSTARSIPGIHPGLLNAPAPPDDLGSFANLIESLRGNVLTDNDADLLYAHSVLGFSLAEIARSWGEGRRRLEQQRLRLQRTVMP